MAIATWADFSSGRPGSAALKATNITGVIRYVGVGSAGKRITANEYADYASNGIQVKLVAELGTNDISGGYAAGVANATAAMNDARSLGIPDSIGIAAACDEHLTQGQITTALAYVQGFRDVLGAARTGAYGFAEFVDAVHSAGLAGWWWKCGSAPTLSESSWVTFWQRNNGLTTETINKVIVDLDDQERLSDMAVGWEQSDTDALMTSTVTATSPTGQLVTLPLGTWLTLVRFHQDDTEAASFATVVAGITDLQTKVGQPTPVTLAPSDLTVLEASVAAAVQTAVTGLNLPVSVTDQESIAKAVAVELGARLTA